MSQAELARQLENAQDRIEELESEQEGFAQEFEGDCTKSLMRLLRDLDYEWDDDGVTADQACQFIRDTVDDGVSHAEWLQGKRETAESERDHLKQQLSDAQDRILALQQTLAQERMTA